MRTVLPTVMGALLVIVITGVGGLIFLRSGAGGFSARGPSGLPPLCSMMHHDGRFISLISGECRMERVVSIRPNHIGGTGI